MLVDFPPLDLSTSVRGIRVDGAAARSRAVKYSAADERTGAQAQPCQ